MHAFTSLTGKGVTGEVNGHKVMLGNQALFTEFDMELGDLVQRAEALRQEGQTVMFVAVDGQPAGLLGIADPIKTSTPRPFGPCVRMEYRWSCSPGIAGPRRRP